MTIEEIQKICMAMPYVTEDIKWETHLCFCVGGKIFIITSPDDAPVNASFKVSDENFELLQEKEGCIPAPYLARYKWIMADDLNRFSSKEWKALLQEAYRLVYEKLPAKTRKSLAAE